MAQFIGGRKFRQFSEQWGKHATHEVRVGFFQSSRYQKEDGGKFVAQVAAWNEFGTKSASGRTIIPERPFFRNTIAKRSNRDALGRTMKRNIDPRKGVLTERGARQTGAQLQGMIQRSIVQLKNPPNAPRTIKMKGSTNPLIDTGHMRQSVTHEIRETRPQRSG